MSGWYYQKSGNQFGAISGSDLKTMADAGRILPSDLVRKVGKTEWRPAGEVKGLYSVSAAAISRADEILVDGIGLSSGNEPARGLRGPFSFLSFMIALASIFVGGASITAFWTPFAGWTIPLAMTALIAGTLTLVMDWFRDVPRFSVSVMGVATGTLALCFAFVHQGGLDFQRYIPIVITREILKKEVMSDPTPEATKELQSQTLPDVPEPSLKQEDLSSSAGKTSLPAQDQRSVAGNAKVQAKGISSTSSAVSGVVVTPLTLEGFPKVEWVALCTPGKGATFGTVQKTHTLGQVMLISPGTYDLWYTTRDTGTILVLKDFEVPAKQKVTVQSNRLVSSIVVKDLGLGVKLQRISVVPPGGNKTFNELAHSGGFGQPILVSPDKEYDVIVSPEGGEPVVVAERVRPRAGERLVVGDDNGSGDRKTAP